MAVPVPFGIATSILTMLGSSALREISLVYGVENDMRKLENTIKAALLDADQKQDKSHLVRQWIKRLNGVLYDVDDLLDAFSTKALQRDGRVLKTQVHDFFSPLNPIAVRYKMGKKIKEMRERLDEITKDMRDFNFISENVIVGARVNYEGRETHSFVLMSDVIGREKEKEEIIKLLMSSSNKDENVFVIPIVGIGGLGKTTLAQSVYGDERVVNYFELRIWVCVSEDFETKSLVTKMLKSITNNEVGDLEMDQLQIRLREKLDGKRYLLILDDIWNENSEKWVGVRNLLMGGAKGSLIVVTTRSRKVASVMGIEFPYVFEEESWALFEKVAFTGQKKVNSKLDIIGKEIVMKCKGVPLAVKSLASVMQSITDGLSIRNSDIWSLCQDDDSILPILKLSYDHLPSYLRQCFSYCAIFPKDYEIEEELLIQLWMAQGYIQSPRGSKHLESIGNQYFRDLLSRSFFQEVQVDDYNEVKKCKMHDLIHDLAVRVAGSDCFISETDIENVHHVSFQNMVTNFPKAKGLRTHFVTNLCPLELIKINVFRSNSRCLRVLDVHRGWFDNVPPSISKLQHLRYLDLSQNKMISLPNSISSLVNLQTLKLSDCFRLKRLPRGITKLMRLRYLMIDDCKTLDHMPTGMGMLTSLRRLDKFVVGRDKESLRLRELSGLNELRGKLHITGLEKVTDVRSESNIANLLDKQYLHGLTMEWVRRIIIKEGNNKLNDDDGDDDDSTDSTEEILLEGLQPHPELRKLEIKGYFSGRKFPNWMMMGNMLNSLPNIVEISLYGCDRCRHLPPLLDQLKFLKFLTLRRLHGVEHIEDDDNNNLFKSSSSSSSLFFPSLEILVIEDLPNLKGWWRAAVGTVVNGCRTSFPRLTRLSIDACPRFTCMPYMNPHLEVLDLNDVPEKLLHQLLTTKTTTEGSAISSSSSSFSSPLSKLRSVRISNIEDLEYLSKEAHRNLVSLEHLSIRSCPRLSRVYDYLVL